MCIENPTFLRDLFSCLQQYRNMNNTQINMKLYKDADSILKLIDYQGFDLVFLDIRMLSERDYAITRKLKKTESNTDTAVIFISNFLTPSVVEKGKYLGNVIFLTEPINFEKIELLINEFLKLKLIKDKKSLLVKNNRGLFKIRLSDILYLERHNKSIIIHTKTEEIISLKTLKDYEDHLQKSEFFRCHNSYIVNLEYIVNIKSNHLSMLNEHILPISRHRRKALFESISVFKEVYCSTSI